MPDENTTATPSIPPVDPSVAAAIDDAVASAVSSEPVPEPAQAAPNPEPVSPVVVAPEAEPLASNDEAMMNSDIHAEVANKIRDSRNVLIALSSDPSVDEMAAAIGLSLYLDKLGKRATAIYSGATPNALEFLKPEETFEPTVDTLQDFVIALNKDKADHLRYRLDGDYVKIFITPYKTRISEEDLDFSYGDFNVDLVLALDVANGIDLDSALREHGRIMHDAVIVNITTGNPGKFGEIEWSEKSASSVSEMIARLLYSSASETKIGKEEATAFLTGIVAATNRFSNGSTTPETMQVASKLMESGANQQLVSKNITPDVENEMFSLDSSKPAEDGVRDPTKLDIAHKNGDVEEEGKQVEGTVTEKDSTLLDDLKAAEASLAQTGAETTPETDKVTLKIDEGADGAAKENAAAEPVVEPAVSEPEPVETPAPVNEPQVEEPKVEEKAEEKIEEKVEEPEAEAAPVNIPPLNIPPMTVPPVAVPVSAPVVEPSEVNGDSAGNEGFVDSEPEKVLTPSSDFGQGLTEEEENKYGKMLEDALESVNNAAAPAVPEVPAAPVNNPAMMNAPAVPAAPEINGVPEMNYMPMPGEEILPPPPAPPIDMSGGVPMPSVPSAQPSAASVQPIAAAAVIPPVGQPIEPAALVEEPAPTSLGDQPAMQDQVYGAQAVDPGAFKIPGT